MGRLAGRTALVTGAAKGIGWATAERFLAEGARVAAVVRPGSEPGPPGAAVIEADVTGSASMAAAVATAAGAGRLDICVANAGAFLEYEPFVDADPLLWDELMAVNLLGVLTTFRAAARHMVADGHGGRLLATSSVAGLRGEVRSPAYGATKAGVRAVVQSLAVELGPFGVTVNAVAPGQIDTEMNRRNMASLGAKRGLSLAELRRAWVGRIPVGRMGHARDVAATFAFLASDDAAFISGETIRVDGGELVSQGAVESLPAVASRDALG